MTERINIIVDDGIPEKLERLAGGKRRMGDWISKFVISMCETQEELLGDDTHMLKLSVGGLAGQVKGIDARVSKIEHLVLSITKGDNHG